MRPVTTTSGTTAYICNNIVGDGINSVPVLKGIVLLGLVRVMKDGTSGSVPVLKAALPFHSGLVVSDGIGSVPILKDLKETVMFRIEWIGVVPSQWSHSLVLVPISTSKLSVPSMEISSRRDTHES